MSDANQHGFDPIPLQGLPTRSGADLPAMGLLPPMPKPAQPVEPRPRTEPTVVRSDAIIDNKPEPVKAPVPGRMAWLPEAARVMVRPTRAKGIFVAGLASLAAGAFVAKWFWPAPKPVALRQTDQPPTPETKSTQSLPTPPAPAPAPVIKTEPLPTTASQQKSVEVPLITLPPMNTDTGVKPAAGVDAPIPLPQKVLSEEKNKSQPIAEPQKKDAPAIPLPDLPTVPPPPPPILPPVSPPPLPAAVPATSSGSMLQAPSIDVKSSETSITTPEIKPSASGATSDVRLPVAPPIELPKSKPTTPPANNDLPAPTVSTLVLPETKPLPLPEVKSTPPMNLPEAKETPFVSAGTAKPLEPSPEPKLRADLPRLNSAPREDYDVDVHYPAAGDTWSSISKKHLGDERYADALKAYNAERGILGQQPIDVPPIHVLRRDFAHLITPARRVEPASLETLRSGQKVWEVPSGGLTLKEISRQAFGDENLWGQIWEMNPKLRADEPVPGGTKVKLPDNARIGDR